ncbi:cAMP-dependent protein kinase pathway protein (Som1), putative [Talaromyces stipitatus ATCC 10500]|uniref:cAMP-dependent protein kinase pathway protein (Som1), putative n=1 Tax=Talaromyces stipitatus (strain ATCC 10500 / CBS 375.48 / QM 6759 / NRRL 1006) TaxID=441959 RepID=B8MTZ9_TALSN|nr:cAMP-dependent protein kinase pathway protein (Som1), putative [Talaromyces stipitatus ATCC 10500]EED12631.1 cAMP-dependent protein kinase pathway protein (Som1), putative [Talaromyces stipitatus ATCC 10500]
MNQINIAGMAGMNAMPGGPVGGVPMMNTQSAAPRSEPPMTQESVYVQLNTCIYDYFLKRGQFDAARMLLNDDNIKLDTDDLKTSPNHMNGVDGDTSMGDSKDEKIKIPDDFPRPRVPMDSGNSFLFEWFSLFWDIFAAQRKRPPINPMAQHFVNSSQGLMRPREHQNQNLLRQPAQAQAQAQAQMMMQNHMVNMRRNPMQNMNHPLKTALQNNASGMNPQQIAQLQQNKQQIQMQREHSDMDMNGHRPQSPSSADNAPSPSKRPRLDIQQGQPMPPNGRVQGQIPPQLNTQMLIQNGMNASRMNAAQFQAFQQQQAGQAAAQQKSVQVYSQNLLLHHSRSAMNNQGMQNGLMNNGLMQNQTDLMSQMPDGQGGMQMMNGQFYNGEMAGMGRGGTIPPNGNGNHALQDYQMQLMLLEQQNKRRLMMARQEQDSITTRPDGQPMPPGQPGLPPGTSPQGSRTGASPNPSEQMKRGTPKISQTGLPASPSTADLQGRGSPASMNFNPGQMGDMSGNFYNNMRPPTSNQGGFNPQMNQAMQQGPNGRMPTANWQNPGGPQGQQPMVAQQSPATQAAPTPQAQNSMPPPSALPQGTKPPSPQQGVAPPTPQQANKPAPKGKKDTEKNNRKRITKKGAAAANANTAATPSSEAEPPPTPTPSTPITPQHPNSFTKNGVNATTATQQQPTSAPAPQIVQQQPDPNVGAFSDLGMPDASNFNLDFSTLENPEVLEHFDFDSFLNTDADATGFGFDPSSITYPTDGVETGTDGL